MSGLNEICYPCLEQVQKNCYLHKNQKGCQHNIHKEDMVLIGNS